MLKLTSLLTGAIAITMVYAGGELPGGDASEDVVVARADTDVIAPGRLELDDERGAIARAIATSVASPAAASTAPEDVVEPETAVAQQAVERTEPLFVINANNVNLRGGPSTANRVVDQASRGEEVAVVSRTDDGWIRIRLDSGNEAYIFGRFLEPAS